MKKYKKFTIVLIFSVLILISVIAISNEANAISGIIDSTTSNGDTPEHFGEIFSKVLSFVRGIAVFVAIICLLIIGIKIISGSTEERLDGKKAMLPFVIGCIVAACAVTIVQSLIDLLL